ncbi:MAG: cytochrome c [Alphaproteobacteria bacterium]|nr:cytochrome c [Alphaproteobacteria bacterium]
MQKKTASYGVIGILAIGLGLGMVFPAGAADDPANVIKYRQLLMKSIGAHMGSIAMVVKGEVSAGAAPIEDRAASIVVMSTLITSVFQENPGNTAAETTAKPDIWTDWSGFEGKANGLRDAAEKLVAAAQGGDMAAIGAAVGVTGKACGACHDTYRVKKD